jgi:neutral ceramidase
MTRWRPSDEDCPLKSSKRSGWRCGYAEADITPAPGQALPAGFGKERYARGRVAPLIAQAIVLEDPSGKRAVIVASDVLGYSRVTIDALRQKLSDLYALAPDEVAFPCSHTHCGPAVNFGLTFAVGGLNVWYLAHLENTLIDLVGRALSQVSSATVSYGEADCQIGMNRRLVKGREVQHRPNPDGVYDRHTPILRIRRRKSPKDVVLVCHACHPTSTGAYERWSPDWPGAMRRRLSAKLEDCKAVFVKGCGADANVVHTDTQTGEPVFSRDPRRARAAGVRLANQVLRYLDETTLKPLDASLVTTIMSGNLSLKRKRPQAEIRSMAAKGDNGSHLTWWARQSIAYPDARRSVEYDAQVWRIGGLKMFWLEGEVCADLGIALREMAGGPVATVGYSNACPGYISSARLIREGGYEGDTSHMAYFLPAPFAEKSEGEFMGLCRKAITQLS